MLRFALIVALILTLASPVAAQTSTRALAWDQPLATVTEAMAFIYTLKIDAAPPAIVTAACALVSTVTRCSTPLAAFGPGAHTLVLTVTNGFDSATSSLSGSSPAGAINLRIVVTVTVP